MRQSKSNYTWKIDQDFLLIEDLDTGNKSVTNDIENVINDIYHEIGEKIKNYKVIYKDSHGIWDGVNPSWGVKKCVSCDFYHIGEYELKNALIKIKQNEEIS
jgi:hypothetical protein